MRGLHPILRGKRTPTTRHTNILPGDHRPAISDVHYFWGTSEPLLGLLNDLGAVRLV